MVTTKRKKWKLRTRENSMYGNPESKDPILGCTHHKNNPIGVPDIEARINTLD